MNNVAKLQGVARLVQVGIRDFGEDELETVRGSEGRIISWFDADLARERFEGTSWGQQGTRILSTFRAGLRILRHRRFGPALCRKRDAGPGGCVR